MGLGHHIVKCERCRTDKLLLLQIAKLIHVVHIVHFNEEVLVLLKVVADINGCNKLRVQTIEDAFSLSNLLPLVLLDLPEHAERITLRTVIQVRQIQARNSKHQLLS